MTVAAEDVAEASVTRRTDRRDCREMRAEEHEERGEVRSRARQKLKSLACSGDDVIDPRDASVVACERALSCACVSGVRGTTPCCVRAPGCEGISPG